MKNLLLALLLALPLCSFAQKANKKDAAAAQEVEKLERQRFAAQVSKDYAFLDKSFGDDLIYTHSNGKQNNKTEYVQSIRDGKSVYDKIDVENLNVRGYNDGKTAVVNGQIVIYQPNKPDGTPNIAHLKYTVVQIKDPKKGWQVVLWQSQKQAEK
ncbi:MAG: nuclear transport factor 2 family protein [Janthinobacterium lividum]